MKQRIIILLAFIFISMESKAQTSNKGELAISLSGGSSRPLGGFEGKDMYTAAIFRENVSNPWVMGINKSENGFARPGYYYAAQMNYGISNRFFVFFRAGIANNPVAERVIEDYFFELYPGWGEGFNHTDYRIRTLTPGIGYSYQLRNWGFSTGLLAGRGQLAFPYFKMVVSTATELQAFWGHDGPRPDLNSLAYGGIFNLSYETGRFRTGLEIVYQRADFDYSMTTRTIPGGNFNPEYHDTIKSSLLFIGIQVSYSIIKGNMAGK
jgi:hypothetical protein